jgi:hypothetical protein
VPFIFTRCDLLDGGGWRRHPLTQVGQHSWHLSPIDARGNRLLGVN